MPEVATQYKIWSRIMLNGGEENVHWYTSFRFNEARFVQFDASPDDSPGNDPADLMSVQVVEQWADRVPGEGTKYHVRYRNRGTAPVTFRPRMAVVPADRFFGGGSS